MTLLRNGTPEEAGMLPERIDLVRDLVTGWVEAGYSPAISVLVARRGVIALHEAFGVQGPEADASRLRTDHLFPVMSVTKMLTATVVMSLVEEGLLGLNRPVVDYLPEFTGGAKDQVLVHHLLTHTWGENIDKILEGVVKAGGGAEPCTPSSKNHPLIHGMLRATFAAPLAQPPGELMEYGVFGYALLGEIAERVSGRPLEDLMHERIFEPLGMKDSWLVLPETESPRAVRRAEDAPLGLPSMLGPGLNSRAHQELPFAAGGVYSTPRDLGVLCQTFLNGGRYGEARMLSRPTVEAMMRNQIPGVPFEFGGKTGQGSMGYGWFVESSAKWRPMGSLQTPGSVNHAGLGASIVWIDPLRELVGVYCEVLLEMSEDYESLWNFDLFQNAITAAIDD